MHAPELLDVITHDAPDGDDAGSSETAQTARRGAGIWGLLLVLVIVLGYLTTSRRKALGTLVEQITDIVRDFRGYDPEF